MTDNVQVRFGLICDDARREDNGKIFLIGVYGKDIQLDAFPATLYLSLVLFLDADTDAEFEFAVEARFNDQKTAAGQATLVLQRGKNSIMYLPKMPVKVDGPGMISFQMSRSGGEWETVAELPLVKR